MASSPNPSFPQGAPQRLKLASAHGGGLQSWNCVCPRQTIIPGDVGVALTDASTFAPVQAVFVNCRNVQADPYGNGPNPPTQWLDYPSTIDDATRCLSLWMNTLRPGSEDIQANGLEPPVVPQAFELQIRVAANCVSETVAQFVVTPGKWYDNGFLITLSGYMCNQWEVWGRVIRMADGVPNPAGFAYPLSIGLTFIIDRIGQDIPSGLGFNANTKNNQVSGRLVTAINNIQYYP